MNSIFHTSLPISLHILSYLVASAAAAAAVVVVVVAAAAVVVVPCVLDRN